MKSKKITGLLLLFFLAFLLGNCTTEGALYEIHEENDDYYEVQLTNGDRNTWGWWVRMDNDHIIWHISSAFIRIYGASPNFSSLELEMESANIIKVTQGSSVYYLIRLREPD